MKFIRIFFGDIKQQKEKYIKEFRYAARNRLDEVAFVWGDENCNIIRTFGYEVIKMSSEPFEYGTDMVNDTFNFMSRHKLEAIRRGVEMFGECVYVDWDCHLIKPIDEDFWITLRKQNKSFQMPLYSFPKVGYLEEVFHRWSTIPDFMRQYTTNLYNCMLKYNYDFKNDMVVPCSSFVYCSDTKYIDAIIDRYNNDESTYYDEAAWLECAKETCPTLDDYLKTYEPLVCNAKTDAHFNQKEFNEYMYSVTPKNLYFIHE